MAANGHYASLIAASEVAARAGTGTGGHNG
jgi:hypothetical protein